ncbi:cell surface glycoprotein CD200 receptor 1-A isoform X1 [Astyanax mexicanus]|uniref:cell surface glycoprotein CD200 receptor 1-A isoform X1 n=1 Tax=Astyanax mexicanus TaxID=7994 RepID=UPI0020CABEC3|nr:cell surface glycoprotein CD200 receptor 1-A isoform X1 [Astyanax mexicanus]
MENTRLLRAVLVLAVCFTIHSTSGEAVRMFPASNKTTSEISEGSRNESVEMGNNITLLCTNKKVAWNKMLYVIWKIYSQEKNCYISVSTSDPAFNNCTDGKQIINESTSGNYSLFIPQFSSKDEGRYICDMSYQAGGFIETINVSTCDRLTLTGWLEKDKDGHTFAVCRAQGKPAASIYWKTPWNVSSPRTNSSINFTVTSRLQLPHKASPIELTCVVPSSSCNKEEIQFNTFQDRQTPDFSIAWPFILLGVCVTCITVTFLTALYIMREKIGQLSVFRKLCCTPQIPTPAREEKTPQPRDPEEVEPYASYVQRVNSIYNSSAELFNA